MGRATRPGVALERRCETPAKEKEVKGAEMDETDWSFGALEFAIPTCYLCEGELYDKREIMCDFLVEDTDCYNIHA